MIPTLHAPCVTRTCWKIENQRFSIIKIPKSLKFGGILI